MKSGQRCLKLIPFLVLLIYTKQYCDALADQAVYIIENLGSKQVRKSYIDCIGCLSAGGVRRNSSNANITLFKQGRPLSKPCSDTSALNTTDFSQQWMVKMEKENPENSTYELELVMLNTLYYDANLTAELRGGFIMYFPDRVKLKARQPIDESTQSQEFVIRDPDTKNCLGENAELNVVRFENCDDSSRFQRWNFTLVNEKFFAADLLNASSARR